MADPVQPQQDLLGRWLAHVDSRTDPAPAPEPTTQPTTQATPVAPRHRGEPVPETPEAPEGASLREAVAAAVLRSLEPTQAQHADVPGTGPDTDSGLGTGTGTDSGQATADTRPAPPGTTPVAVRADHVFTPRRATRRVLTAVTLAAAVLTALALRAALAEPDSARVGLAVIAAVTTLVLWVVRASATPARLRVQLGQLEVVRGHRRDVVDLASDYTDVEVQGRPGHRGWRVVFPRREGDPVVVDASVVDPEEFMRVLRAYRPEPGADATPASSQ